MTPLPQVGPLVSTYLFSATVNLGGALAPIPQLGGGTRVVEPITGGKIYGPAFNATIEGGLAAPILLNDNETTWQIPRAYAYGHASDGSPFYLEEDGIGSSATQNSRVIIQVGGKYADLQNMFVLGQPSVNAERTEVTVECWSVPLPQ
ncbi:uncharacterized protein BJX67DRAFT_391585 [Aspergillus lucknowensis]|uniref:Uncharacterized protein n=1 Tax=Aspergillus lucknowensis TaxID=176173 RepID=A0ABR4L9F9_9EURO